MALDARTRSSIYGKFAEILGDDDANALMSQFPSVEADELVTKHFLRAEMAQLRGEIGERFYRQTVWLGSALVAATTVIVAAIPLLT